MRLEPPSSLGEPAVQALAAVEAQMGFVPNSLRAMAHRPAILQGFMALGAAVMGPGSISPTLKQMTAYVASLASGCRYCQAHTAHQVHRQGVDAERLAALWTFEDSPLFTDPERAVLRLAMLAARTPNEVEDADFAAVRAHFDEAAVAEIVAVIAFFGFLNRWNDTLATPLEDAPLAFARSDLAASGWNAGKHAPPVPGT